MDFYEPRSISASNREEILHWCEIQDKLLGITKENIANTTNDVIELAKDFSSLEYSCLAEVIIHYASIRYREAHLYAVLATNLIKKFNFFAGMVDNVLESRHYYIQNFDLECNNKYFTEYKKRQTKIPEIQVLIMNDDVDSFQEFVSQPGFSYANYTINIPIYQNEYRDELKLELINIASFYGAAKCFKFIKLNIQDAKISYMTANTAIAGGNTEIIRLIELSGFYSEYIYNDILSEIFNSPYCSAIYYNQNDVFQWLCETKCNEHEGFKNKYAKLSIISYNFKAYLYLLEILNTKYSTRNFYSAVSHNNFPIYHLFNQSHSIIVISSIIINMIKKENYQLMEELLLHKFKIDNFDDNNNKTNKVVAYELMTRFDNIQFKKLKEKLLEIWPIFTPNFDPSNFYVYPIVITTKKLLNDVVDNLLDCGFSINGASFVCYGCDIPVTLLYYAVTNRSLSLAKYLLSRNDIDIGLNYLYPLNVLCLIINSPSFQDLDLVQKILNHKDFDVNLKAKDTKFYLEIAIEAKNVNQAIIELVANHPLISNEQLIAGYILSCSKCNLISTKFLFNRIGYEILQEFNACENGFNIYIHSEKLYNDEMLDFFISNNLYLENQIENEINVCSSREKLKIAKKLFPLLPDSRKAAIFKNVSILFNNFNEIPKFASINEIDWSSLIENELISHELINDLLDQNIIDPNKCYLLHFAIKSNNIEMVKKLCQMNVTKLNIIDIEGMSPMKLARKYENKEAYRIIYETIKSKKNQNDNSCK